jgi:hypothetical protein
MLVKQANEVRLSLVVRTALFALLVALLSIQILRCANHVRLVSSRTILVRPRVLHVLLEDSRHPQAAPSVLYVLLVSIATNRLLCVPCAPKASIVLTKLRNVLTVM